MGAPPRSLGIQWLLIGLAAVSGLVSLVYFFAGFDRTTYIILLLSGAFITGLAFLILRFALRAALACVQNVPYILVRFSRIIILNMNIRVTGSLNVQGRQNKTSVFIRVYLWTKKSFAVYASQRLC